MAAAAGERHGAGSPAVRAVDRRVAETLRETFGLKRLRASQAPVISRVMRGLSTLAIMPTGAGKSLCYQLPAMLLPGRTIVVSPLVALMKDQCDKLRGLGLPAVQANSAVAADEATAAEAAIADGSAKVVFTTPERLANPAFLESLKTQPTSLFVVDEAHCISAWGHDFRPAFLEIGAALAPLGAPAVLALTATAPEAVVADVAKQLAIPAAGIVYGGAYRPNLHYRVEQATREEEKLARAVEIVRAAAGAGLVYASTVKGAQTVHDALAAAGESVALYHGRLAAGERRRRQEAFMSGDVRVMVATNAFGLGIDKPDTRFVLHYQMPSGLDAYYQESGRAGRDGEAANCTLLYLHSDKAVQQFFLVGRYPGEDDLEAVWQALCAEAPEGGWSIETLQQRSSRSRAKAQVAVNLLVRQGLAARDAEGRIEIADPAASRDRRDALVAGYRDKRRHDREMLERMVFYGQTGHCRWRVLLEHFDDRADFDGCGTCDNCERIARQASAAAAAASDGACEAIRPGPAESAPPPHAAFSAGERVRVKRYGVGEVVEANAEDVTVEFADGTRRCFLAEYLTKAPSAKPESGRRRLSGGRTVV